MIPFAKSGPASIFPGSPGKARFRFGFVLWISILTVSLLGILLFSFNKMVQNQAVEAHHHLLAKSADLLARSAMEIIVSRMGSGFEEALMREVESLYARNIDPEKGVLLGQKLADELKQDLNAYLAQCNEFSFIAELDKKPPACTEVKVEFRNKGLLIPNFDTQIARDPSEKRGEINVSCVISYHGLKRKVISSRNYFLVSMVPGPYCRFTLFAPFTPWEFSFNALGVAHSGSVDASYVHPWPKSIPFTGPLVLNNATAAQKIESPDDEQDLQNSGWVFLGPAPKKGDTTRSEPIYLKIPSGYDNKSGGAFHYLLPPVLVGSKKLEALPQERVEDPAHLSTAEEKGFASFQFGTKYEGFFTVMKGDQSGAQGLLLWDVVNGPRWLCASTWLMPFGNRDFPSRTLIIGPVLAGYLKIYTIQGEDRNGKKFAGIIRGLSSEETYRSENRIDTLPSEVAPFDFRYNALFKQPSTTPIGWKSFQTVYPYSSIPHPQKMGPVGKPVAFNRLFDFMKYAKATDEKKPLIPMDEMPSLAGSAYDDKPRSVPCSARMRAEELSKVKGLHPSENVKIMLPKTDGVEDSSNDAVYFHGSLKEYDIQKQEKEGLYFRITHSVDLTDVEASKEQERFQDSIFRPSTSDDPCKAGFFVPKRSGIISVERKLGKDSLPLKFPGKIFVDKSMVLFIQQGGVTITETITTGDPPKPGNLFSVVTADGDILIDPKVQEIHAYLAAMGPGKGFGAGGSRILSTSATNKTPLKIFGGMAAWEMGLYYEQSQDPRTVGTTMEHFSAGGSVTYNGYFNPSSPLYKRSRSLIFEDSPWTIQFAGGS